ncbi:hypothetical protein [Pararhizobium sp. IMCC21322]|uniref:hypothetical protein n=1 Tax=Pararhizobium sp. IMCC21322 TaxID=3067903 RepID=UPI002742064E|nr:hypothetical protein [Pararhizobium sp. IMCC21322]
MTKFGGFKLAVKTFDGTQIADLRNGDILSLSKRGAGATTPQLTDIMTEIYQCSLSTLSDASGDPNDCPLTRRQLCLGPLYLYLKDLVVLVAINVIEHSTERFAASIKWQNAEEYIHYHALVASQMATIGLGSDTEVAAWIIGGNT